MKLFWLLGALILLQLSSPFPAAAQDADDEWRRDNCVYDGGYWSDGECSYQSPPPTRRTGSWLSSAYSAATDHFDVVVNAETRPEAERNVLEKCNRAARERGARRDDCEIVTSLQDRCVAVVGGGHGETWGAGDTQTSAKEAALARCGELQSEHCAIELLACSPGDVIIGR